MARRRLTLVQSAAWGDSQTHGINDAGEIVGVTGTQFGGVRPFIYLPTALHGLSSGLHEIGPTMAGYTGSGSSPLSVTARIFINNRGQALLTPGIDGFMATNGFLWQRGQSWPLEQLADTSGYQNRQTGGNPWSADYRADDPQNSGLLAHHAPRGFNDRGEILLNTVVASYVSENDYDHVLLLFRPKLVASIALDSEKSAPGATNKVRLRLRNASTATLTSPGTPVLHWDGPGTPNILSGPTMVSTNSWSPGVANEWVWTFRFTNETTGTWVAQGSAGTNNSTLAESALLKVLDQADLWVRRTNDVAWKGNDIYFEEPVASQTRETRIQPTETASFNVRVQNDSERSRELTVQAVASGDPGWLATYKQDATNVSALITGGGLNVGTLASGAFVDLTVELRGSNALDSGSRREIVFTGKPLGATNGSDVVKVAAEVLNEIIVNSTGDQPDASLTDGVPDVNTNMPDLQTTLRCAIDFANRKAGKDIIKFQIPDDDLNYYGGRPLIQPRSAFSNIVDAVIIDGWSQDPSSDAPVIEISGLLLVDRPSRPEAAISLGQLLNWDGAASGLDIQARDCEIRGLRIFGFPLCGIRLRAGGTIVQGNHIGFRITGSEMYPAANGAGGVRSVPDVPYEYYVPYQYHLLRGAGIGGRARIFL